MSEKEPEQQANRLIGGRYRLSEQLGSGAMGVVWAGYDELLHRPVAVKEVRLPVGLPPEDAADVRERTLREARSIAVVNQSNVILVYDVVAAEDAPFVVMELVTGPSLGDLLRENGPLDDEATAAVADALAGALLAAHRSGITHRDVKPGNVLLGTGGQIKLTDFGIARSVSDATMTHTGIIMGSPAYIAPEIAAGEKVTPTSDLWSLGATLFAARTGRAPYDLDSTVLATLHEVVNGPVPEHGVPGPVGEAISGLMTKDPAQRMDLLSVRRLMHPLMPAPGSGPFDLSTADTLAEHTVEPVPRPQPVLAPPPAPVAPPAPASAPLAGDPGPLPFAPRPQPAKPSRLRTPALVLASVLLFLIAGTGTFAAARVLGGKPVLPVPQLAPVDAGTPAPVGQLVQQEGLAQTLSGASGGGFKVMIPQGWLSFVEQRYSGRLPSASVVHYLSQDGQQEASVERVPAFYPHYQISYYLKSLESSWPPGDLTIASVSATGGKHSSTDDPTTQFTYRTVERGSPGSDDTGRTTYGKAIPDGNILWVVTLRVPTEQEDGGAALSKRIFPTFTPDG